MDPGYCDFLAGNFSLCSTSLGLSKNNGFYLLGRYDQGCGACGPVAVEERSWGSLKAEFR
ncbi:MAG: hypothetical protein GY838_05170 [bacterium]|nr:hypothetical protein [bacterium]